MKARAHTLFAKSLFKTTPQAWFWPCSVLTKFSILLLLSSVQASAQETKDSQLRIHYHIRPPFIDFKDSKVVGLTGALAVRIFEDAKIPFVLLETPASRQLKVMELSKGFDCAVGWFKTPERETYAQFSEPIYHDKPQVALTQADNKVLKQSIKLEDLFKNSELSLLVKDNYSYGPVIDQMIKELHPKVLSTSNESAQMIEMVRQKRVDYMLITQEEAEDVIKEEKPKSSLKKVTLTNAPVGEFRHIICSKKVPADVMKTLNHSIKKLVKLK